MSDDARVDWLDEDRINDILSAGGKTEAGRIREILAKARELKGLTMEEAAALMAADDPELLDELYVSAKKAKEEIYGRRLVFFAPLYIANHCRNECLYCAFRRSNQAVTRRILSMEEIAEETRIIIRQGHKRILLVAGESYPGQGIGYILKAIETIYAVKEGTGEIRRLNANLAPLSLDDFQELKKANIGTYQLFQETYHRETYAKVHVSGKKRDFDWRASAMDRAMLAGIDDVGLGVLYGLADWKFDTLALLAHVAHLEDRFGVGCHTISVPRIEPAVGSELAYNPPHPLADEDFKKLVAILRLTVPYTGLIMSTRENAAMRKETFALGVSQISAGSRTNPGGYADDIQEEASQFQLGDHRSLDEVIKDVSELGYIPSFCTACYRLGRTGHDFMDLAKPGLIKEKCAPNALSTFEEYLLDYAPDDVAAAGERAISLELSDMAPKVRRVSERLLEKVRSGRRDVFC